MVAVDEGRGMVSAIGRGERRREGCTRVEPVGGDAEAAEAVCHARGWEGHRMMVLVVILRLEVECRPRLRVGIAGSAGSGGMAVRLTRSMAVRQPANRSSDGVLQGSSSDRAAAERFAGVGARRAKRFLGRRPGRARRCRRGGDGHGRHRGCLAALRVPLLSFAGRSSEQQAATTERLRRCLFQFSHFSKRRGRSSGRVDKKAGPHDAMGKVCDARPEASCRRRADPWLENVV